VPPEEGKHVVDAILNAEPVYVRIAEIRQDIRVTGLHFHGPTLVSYEVHPQETEYPSRAVPAEDICVVLLDDWRGAHEEEI
jgi:hypothetical protein